MSLDILAVMHFIKDQAFYIHKGEEETKLNDMAKHKV